MTVKAVMLTIRGRTRQVNYEITYPDSIREGGRIDLKWGLADPNDRELAGRLMPSEITEIEKAILAEESVER